MEASSFQFAFLGEGYTEGLDPSQGKPNGKIRILVQGPGTRCLMSDMFFIWWCYKKHTKTLTMSTMSVLHRSTFSPDTETKWQSLKFLTWTSCSIECGYVATPIAMVQAALTILHEPAALPKRWVEQPVHSWTTDRQLTQMFLVNVRLQEQQRNLVLSVSVCVFSPQGRGLLSWSCFCKDLSDWETQQTWNPVLSDLVYLVDDGEGDEGDDEEVFQLSWSFTTY